MESPRRTIDVRLATEHLESADPVMAGLIRRIGPFALRADGRDAFRSLARAIIYQQLSGLAAGTIYARFLALFNGSDGFEREVRRSDPAWRQIRDPFPAPEEVLAAGEDRLRSAGLSRAKTAAIHDLARHSAAGELSPEALRRMDDEELIAHLTRVRGIGRWTAEMFLIFHLRRPNVLPLNDVGINRAIRKQYGFRRTPAPVTVSRLGKAWRPWSTVACWYLWRSEDTRLPDAAAGSSAGRPPAPVPASRRRA
jgi:3-methyladenine DNA glycosylase/8-oxoguanine DNA glycosylase